MITLGENNALSKAQKVELEDAKNYLRKQLMKQSPNINTIYTEVKSHIDANPVLLQMVNNNLALCGNAFVWGLLDLATPLGKQRYLLVVQITIGLLA